LIKHKMKHHYNKFLKHALKLAEKGKGLVSPNPMVGAVVVKGQKIVGSGYHKAFGMPHAEIEALKKAGNRAKGAVLYVNLEPCCHYGKTPPCTEKIVQYGIKEVIACMQDPNPAVNGKGFEYLESKGIKVRTGWLEKEAMELNKPYLTNFREKRPYTILKWAQTIDGKIAAFNGISKWITSEDTRNYSREKRFEADGMIVGINTVLKDNPSLDFTAPAFLVRQNLIAKKRYYKIVLDPGLKTPGTAKIWENKNATVILVVSASARTEKTPGLLLRENCEIIKLKTVNGKFNIKELLDSLFKKNIGIIIVEGGNITLSSFWEEKLADRVDVFIGNKILGGKYSISPITGEGKKEFQNSVDIKNVHIRNFGENILISGEPCFPE
jgi:diaminohydroxyphosphoribosylaminopyrimidine deaminase / 5-amino-6-(5-phosphoribosylamino)uracil reductase